MNFEIDEQTIQDLELFEDRSGSNSLYNLFNHAKTLKGRQRLLEMMQTPIKDEALLQRRIDSIKFFEGVEEEFKVTRACLNFKNRKIGTGYVNL